jgi:hypothetical protein
MNSTFGRSAAIDTSAKKKGSRETKRMGQACTLMKLSAMRNNNNLAWKSIAPVASWAHESRGEIDLPYRSIKTGDTLNAYY